MNDGRLLVLVEFPSALHRSTEPEVRSIPIEDENEFLRRIVFANLPQPDTIEIIGKVLLAVTGRYFAPAWVSVELDRPALRLLGLLPDLVVGCGEDSAPPALPDIEDLQDAILQAPVPICLLSGPEHRFALTNNAYVRLVGRTRASQLLNKPVHEALFDLVSRPFFALLDQVYRTGEPAVGKEVQAFLFEEGTERTLERWFDLVYYPVRGRDGELSGILCQAADATERVLERQVRDAREAQLYRQWAELDALYRQSPLGICLVDAKTLRILRMNQRNAASFGLTVDQAIGRTITELVGEDSIIAQIYRQCCRDPKPLRLEVSPELAPEAGHTRASSWSLAAVLGASGEIEAVSSLVFDFDGGHVEDATLVADNAAPPSSKIQAVAHHAVG